MKKFVLMHFGFEKPNTEMIEAWKAWFASIQPHLVDMGNVGFAGGREVSAEGTRDLPWDRECITGLSIVAAESLDAAEKLTEGNPYVSAIRIYEIRSH